MSASRRLARCEGANYSERIDVPIDPRQFERLTEAGFELFPATADGILQWVSTTRPRPPRADVVAHVRTLVDDALLPEREVDQLVAAGYVELLD